MLHELKINGLPETTDSLAWSEAGDLCIAIGGRVHLYIPLRKSGRSGVPERSPKPWSSVFLEVNAFSRSEWPPVTQQPYADFSIGEEESESHVISCSWSAPGLALHDRCALGILTANGLYSLWDADGDTSYVTSWKRLLVINRIIEAHFAATLPKPATVSARRLRIRAATWSKALELHDQPNVPNKFFFLAVLNDEGEIILLKLECAGETLLSRDTVSVIHVLNLDRQRKQYPDGLLDELEWFEWDTQREPPSSILLCSTEGKTWTVTIQIDNSQSGPSQIIPSILTSDLRAVSEWNTTKGEAVLLDNQFFKERHVELKKAWQMDNAEGYPAFTRSYGTAAYRNFQAVHVSFHPSTVIEYDIQAHQFSYVLFSHLDLRESAAAARQFQFDWENLVEIKSSPDGSAAAWAVILSNVSDLQVTEAEEETQVDLRQIIIRLYLVLALFKGWQLTETSALLAGLSGRQGDENILEATEEYREESETREALQQIERIVNTSLANSTGIEVCSICHSRLSWNGETGAICGEGHQFDRCSLTLLAIQEPGISKFCGSCKREYIDRNFLAKNNDSSNSRTQQFLSSLFKAFPRCIYCEGSLRSFS